MVNASSRNFWTGCWLGLALLVLLPESAWAQRRRGFQEEYEDPICVRREYGVCQKFHLGIVGGGLLSTDGAASGLGVEFAYTWVVAPRFEVGGYGFVMKDVRFEDGPAIGTVEATFRIATLAGPYQRFFVQFGAGGSYYDTPEHSYWAFPAGSGGVALELSGPGLGLYLTADMSLMWAEGLAAVPRVGVGVVF